MKGKDIGTGFERFLDFFKNAFTPRERKAPLKTVHRNTRSRKGKLSIDYDKETRQKKIDAILDKISKSGYESLTKAEKDFLFKAGKED